MTEILTKELSRKKYFIYFALCALGIIVSAFALAEIAYQNSFAEMDTMVIQKIVWMPFFSILGILLMRRRADIFNKKSSLFENIAVALLFAGVFTFLPMVRPKYLLIVMIIFGFIPKRKIHNNKSNKQEAI